MYVHVCICIHALIHITCTEYMMEKTVLDRANAHCPVHPRAIALESLYSTVAHPGCPRRDKQEATV